MATLILNSIETDELLTEIITGKRIFMFRDNVFALRQPSSQERDSSRLVYTMRLKEYIARGLPTREEMKNIIIKYKLLEDNFYIKKKRIEQNIDRMSKAKEMSNSPDQIMDIESSIHRFFDELRQLETREEMIMLNTAETNAEIARTNYLVSVCTMFGYELDKRYWSNYDEFNTDTDKELRDVAREEFFKLMRGFDGGIIRALARTSEWRKRWEVSKKTGTPVFDGTSANWDKNKVELCYWSNFYDNILEHTSPPPDEVFNDDDKLFDWIRKTNNRTKNGGDKKGVSNNINTPYKIRV